MAMLCIFSYKELYHGINVSKGHNLRKIREASFDKNAAPFKEFLALLAYGHNRRIRILLSEFESGSQYLTIESSAQPSIRGYHHKTRVLSVLFFEEMALRPQLLPSFKEQKAAQ